MDNSPISQRSNDGGMQPISQARTTMERPIFVPPRQPFVTNRENLTSRIESTTRTSMVQLPPVPISSLVPELDRKMAELVSMNLDTMLNTVNNNLNRRIDSLTIELNGKIDTVLNGFNTKIQSEIYEV